MDQNQNISRMNGNQLAENGNQTSPDLLNGLQNIDARVEHRHHRRTDILNGVQDKEKRKKKKKKKTQ